MAMAEVKMPPFAKGKKQLQKVDVIGAENCPLCEFTWS